MNEQPREYADHAGEYALPLSGTATDIAIVGGKAASLARLAGAGFPVPRAFVVTTDAYRRFVSANGMQEEILRSLAALDEDASQLEASSDRIRKLFDEATIPSDVLSAIVRSYRDLTVSPTAVAVRSSATAEDLPDASFAGQQETFLNISGPDGVVAAVKRCWASLWNPRAISYRRRQGIGPGTVALAVVVQLLVPADCSGILFTADPVTGQEDRLFISTSWGLGNAVVGGMVNADSIVVEKADGRIIQRTVGDKQIMTVMTEAGTDERPTSEDLRVKAVLTDVQVARLTDLGVRIEQMYGIPMDIEWALRSEQLYILQARPITVLEAASTKKGPRRTGDGRGEAPGRESQASMTGKDDFVWNDSIGGEYLWSNVNFGEAVSDVMTPLTWSVLSFALEDWVFVPGRSNVGNIGGYPYLNISVFASLFSALGRDRQALLREMEPTLYISIPDSMDIPVFPLSGWHLLHALWCSGMVRYRQWRGALALRSYLELNRPWFDRLRRLIDDEKTSSGLATIFRTDIGPHVKAGAWSVLGAVSRSSVCTMRLRKDLAGLVGPEEAQVLIGNLGGESDPLVSMGPLKGIADVGAGRMTRERYLEEYGHRGPQEFELSVPRPAEDPVWVDDRLAEYGECPFEVDSLLTKQRERFDGSWRRLLADRPDAKKMARRIAQNADLARLREKSRSAYVRDRWAIRLFALRAGQLTGIGDDVFFLTLHEVLDLLAGNKGGVQHVPERRQTYLAYKALPAYPPLIRGRFDPFAWAAGPDRRTDVFDSAGGGRLPEQGTEDAVRLTGSPGSAGRVEGIVRRLVHPDEAPLIRTGEILVTTQTDIAWTVFFPRVAAVVTDVGAPLSHAAIVARELGIPAVVGCGNATTRLKTGDRVLVDGGRGVVQIIEKA